MSTRDTTTIEVEREMWRELNAKKEQPGESFNDVLRRILE